MTARRRSCAWRECRQVFFWLSGWGRPPRFCSNKCRQAAYRDRRKAAEARSERGPVGGRSGFRNKRDRGQSGASGAVSR